MLRCTPLNHAAAMFKMFGQSDPDPQRYLRHTYTHTHTHRQTDRQTDRQADRQRFLAFIERFARNDLLMCLRPLNYFSFQRFCHSNAVHIFIED